MSTPRHRLSTCVLAEAIGTFILVFFGCGAVHVAVLTGDLNGLWQVGIVWGIAIMLAIYTIGGVSGAHINPAITIALAAWNLFPRGRVLGYIAGQLVGAFVAAAALYLVFGGYLAEKEAAKGVSRGEPGSIVTAMCYGEYYPNPGPIAAADGPFDAARWAEMQELVCTPRAFGIELLGTAILAFVVVGITDPRNKTQPERLAPLFIGLTVTALICVIAPLTQACFNPARDFGPRLFAVCAGWGAAAAPGPNGMGIIYVYMIAPIFGAVLGAGLYQLVFRDEEDVASVPGRALVNVSSAESTDHYDNSAN
ncbi:MAG: MIP/aquaporin family protein [Planctomycetaceae bacterium]